MLTHDMKDKQVIVTGGGSGIGLATAKKYVEALK
jgi:NAD(P)-dependent dehydrogenase (short-subunit alcohol dehydrogenase family)